MDRLINKYGHQYSTARLENFSDAVIAVAVTLMVLQIEPPASDNSTDPLHVFLTETLADIGWFVVTFYIICRFLAVHHCVLRSFPEDTPTAGFWLNNFFLVQVCLIPFGLELTNEWGSTSYVASAVYCGLFSGSMLTLGCMSYVGKKPHADMFLTALIFLTPIPFAKVFGGLSYLLWLLVIPVNFCANRLEISERADVSESKREEGVRELNIDR